MKKKSEKHKKIVTNEDLKYKMRVEIIDLVVDMCKMCVQSHQGFCTTFIKAIDLKIK